MSVWGQFSLKPRYDKIDSTTALITIEMGRYLRVI